MLFHSSLRRELSRSFGATAVVLITIVMTMTLIRTLGQAAHGSFNPSDVMVVMGYTVLSDMPTILSLCLFVAVVSVLTRMYRDSEMVIWFSSGKGLGGLVKPTFRFAWPILFVIAALAFFIIPWSFAHIADLKDRYEKRGDLDRIKPGQFQESADGTKVFYIDKDAQGRLAGGNVFIASTERGKETVTTARQGRIDQIGDASFLVLEQGQRLEKDVGKSELKLSVFEQYGTRIGAAALATREHVPNDTKPSVELIKNPTAPHLAELSWRLGLPLAAINFLIIGLAVAGANPRMERTGHLGFAFLLFVVYFNLLNLGKSWIGTGQVSFSTYLLLLHGGALGLSLLALARRHHNWSWRQLLLRQPAGDRGGQR